MINTDKYKDTRTPIPKRFNPFGTEKYCRDIVPKLSPGKAQDIVLLEESLKGMFLKTCRMYPYEWVQFGPIHLPLFYQEREQVMEVMSIIFHQSYENHKRSFNNDLYGTVLVKLKVCLEFYPELFIKNCQINWFIRHLNYAEEYIEELKSINKEKLYHEY